MNRVMRGTVVFAAALGLVSCGGDPTSALRNGIDHLTATPGALFIRPDSTKLVVITAVDKQGNSLGTGFSLGTVGAGITVVADDSFNLVYDTQGKLVPPTNWTRIRYIVSGVANTSNSSFVVSAGGKSITIPVRLVPDSVPGVATSNLTPAVGDTIAVTAPTNFRFSSMSTATDLTGDTLALDQSEGVTRLSVSADSSTMLIVVGPDASGPIYIDSVVAQYAPAVGGYTLTTTNAITTSATLPNTTIAPTTAAAGDTITVTAPAPYKFTPASVPTVTGAGLASLGISADSSTISFLIGPSAAAAVSVSDLIVDGGAGIGTFTLTSGATTLNTPAVPNFGSTFVSATPGGFPNIDTVTMTVAAGFRLLPTATVSFGGTTALVTSRAADSMSLRFIPVPGAAPIAATVNGIVLSFLPTVSLSLPSATLLTPPAPSGAKVLATAPTITIPAAGVTTITTDAGQFAAAAECGNIGYHCLFYKIVLGAPRTFDVTLNWGNTADIGGYFIDAAGNDQFGDFACDANGSGATGQPESCTETLPAGTWYLALADFTSSVAQNTGIVKITITGQ